MGVAGEFNKNLKELEKITKSSLYSRGNSILIKSNSQKNEIIKNKIMKIFTLFSFLIISMAFSAGAEMRTFTSADGSKTLKAKVLDYSQAKGTVKMVREGGKVMTFPVKALCEEDNKYLVSWYQTTMAARKLAIRISDQEEKTSERKTDNENIWY